MEKSSSSARVTALPTALRGNVAMRARTADMRAGHAGARARAIVEAALGDAIPGGAAVRGLRGPRRRAALEMRMGDSERSKPMREVAETTQTIT